jgi:hypothetical protein
LVRFLTGRKIAAFAIGTIVLTLLATITAVVEHEAEYKEEIIGGEGRAQALILFHPSRDARFTDDLSLALADGLKVAGFSVSRATLTRNTPQTPKDYALIAVVSSTYWWSPDIPTLRYLAHARLGGVQVIGLIGGAGSTGRSERLLDEALRKTGATVIRTRSFWIWRRNDVESTSEPNRQVALRLARQFGEESGQIVLASRSGAAR